MQTFRCDCDAHAVLYFDNVQCERCGRAVGFDPQSLQMLSFDPWIEGEDVVQQVADGRRFRRCDNGRLHGVCNWLVDADCDDRFCRACSPNEVIPDLSIDANLEYWAKLEAAKRRAMFGLLSLGIPLEATDIAGADPSQLPVLRFRFMSDRLPDSEFTEPLEGTETIFTGHDAGQITINVAEADDVARARARKAMGERYRTLLGHFRHELGHYYWDLLVAPDQKRLDSFMTLFGDHNADYAEAQQKHYGSDPNAPHPDHISHYATMHPWEDWAETWAHYLHLMDSLETAASLDLRVRGRDFRVDMLPHANDQPAQTLEGLVARWLRLAEAMNLLNRSMGMPDAYPFVLTPTVTAKLDWIHQLVLDSRKPVAH